jgi:DNA gyrase subunit B
MIAALGTGIGEEEYDINALRYHKVIIMTDADVDGSHIRTLLLTFFFRQMPELIENGHLFVAQPPLYRLSDSKKERFIRDEELFNDFILKRISEKERVLNEDGTAIEGDDLAAVMRGLISFYDNLKRLAKKGYDPRFIELLVSEGAREKSLFKEKGFMERFFGKLQDNGFSVQDVQVTEDGGYYEFSVTDARNGSGTFVVNREFLALPELKRLLGVSEHFLRLSQGRFSVSGDGEKRNIEDPQELLSALMEKGKRGLTIQRYKGLGEMNPEQLWTTTMDPERRTLLKVQIEDAVEAHDIFTTLMGEKVGPRREFIQSNALEVTELDI